MLSLVAYRKPPKTLSVAAKPCRIERVEPALEKAPPGALRGRCAGSAAVRAAPPLALVLAGLLGATASAVTIPANEPRPWTHPATHPCGELCGARWALDRMRSVMPAEIYDELARRIGAGETPTDFAVDTGAQIRAMSYARDGTPYMDYSRRVAQFPQGVAYPSRGHFVMRDGVRYRFVQIAACGNWALIVEQDGTAPPALLSAIWPERPWLLGGLDDVILGGAGDDTLAPASEDLPVESGEAAPPRRVGNLFFPAGGNGPVTHSSRFPAGGFGAHGAGGYGGPHPGPGSAFDGAAFAPFDTGWNAFGAPFPAIGPVPYPPNSGPAGGIPFSPTGGNAFPRTNGNPPPPTGGPFPPTGETPFPPPPPKSPAPYAGETLPMPVPLPGTLALCAGWLAALGALRLRRS